MAFFRPMVLFLLPALLPGILTAQSTSALRTRMPQVVSPVSADGTIIYSVTKGDSVLERHTVDLNEELDVIVQFEDPPLSTLSAVSSSSIRTRQTSLAAATGTLQGRITSTHARFRSDLVRLEGEGRAAGSPGTNTLQAARSRLTREYQQVFNGMALSSRRWLIDRLRRLPYVKAIWPDRQVHSQDAGSNHQIGADSVWAELGVTGDSVRIGILDTGIDYTVPDLGGGFGPGHKVAGGWDFVNNDPDPADDNGHGTHVAGIISANGSSLKGVAPEATLYDYKVLDAQGSGESSAIIAALDRAVDPDGDPATDDHLDIVNLSLGVSGGDPTDVLSQAIDNTSTAGVLCVAASGNSGPEHQSVGSPGCATSALTVGACDAADQLAAFSSSGPAYTLFAIKPDIVAPGVNINSTIPGGSYKVMSGTSMAAPHVAGAAALLKQLHRDWTPAILKSALMGGAKDLGQELWRQGKGRLDVWKAARARALATPQTLSFGLDLLSQSQWSTTDTVTVTNLTDSDQTFAVSGTGGLPAGIILSAEPSSVQIPAHESRQLQVTLSIDNTTVQVPKADLQDVTGLLTLSSPQDSLTIPWAVVLCSYLDITFPATPQTTPGLCDFIRFSDSKVFWADPGDSIYSGSTSRLRARLPKGTYEVVVIFETFDTAGGWKSGHSWVVRDSVVVNPAASVVISPNDACWRIGPLLKNEQGIPIDSTVPLSWSTRITSRRTGVGFGITRNDIPLNRAQALDRVSPLSSNFVFDYYYTSRADYPKVYSYAGTASPVTSDQVKDVQPGDFQLREVEYRTHASKTTLKAVETLEFTNRLGSFSYGWDANTTGLLAPFHQAWYSLGHPTANFPSGGVLINHRYWFEGSAVPFFKGGTSAPCLVTPNQAPGADGMLRSSLLLTNSPVQESRTRKVIYGLGPHHYFGRVESYSPTSMSLRTNTWAGMFVFSDLAGGLYVPLFLNQAMDFEPAWLNLRLEDSTGSVIKEGTSQTLFRMDNLGTMLDVSLNLTLPKAGRYSLQVRDGASYVLSLKGAATASLTFDTRLADPNPPTMTSFNIFGADSEYTDMLLPAELGKLEFRVEDTESGLGQVSLFYHTDSSRAWQTLPLTSQGDLYRTTLPAFASRDGFISFRVMASDLAGNSLDYQAEPALHIGKDYTYANRVPEKPSLLTPTPGGLLQLYERVRWVVFSWNRALDYDGWDTLSYTFHIRGSGLGTACDKWLRDTTAAFNFMSYLAPDEIYRWWVETTDGHTVTVSDTATFRTSSAILTVPGTQSGDLPTAFSLAQNYPNPFNPTTTIGYELPQEAQVTLRVYNVLGQEVMTVVDAVQRAGRYSVQIDAQHLASSLYIYRLQAASTKGADTREGSYTAVRKFLLLR